MSKVAMMGTITCQEGRADEMAEVLTAMVNAAHEEPGIEVYSYHRSGENAFGFFALMTDAESVKNHGQTEAMKAAMEAFMPLMAEPPKISTGTPVAAIGLDL